MRVVSFVTVLLFSYYVAFAQSSNPRNATPDSGEALPADTLSNEDLGVILHFPPGWTASETFQDPVLFDPDADAPANCCTQIQLRTQAPASADGGFVSWSVLAVLDRRCLKIGSFPKSIEDRRRIAEFSKAICEAFKHSPFIPPSGMDYGADLAENGELKQVTVRLTGKTTLSALAGRPAPQSGDTQIYTMMSIAAVKGRLILWADISDPVTTAELKTQKIELWHK